MKLITKFWVGLGALAVLSPLGLYLPYKFKGGDAWGEWNAGTIRELAGYVPSGLEKLSSLWKAVMPDYAFRGWGEKGLGRLSLAYIVSALVGIGLCVAGAYLLGKLLTRKGS